MMQLTEQQRNVIIHQERQGFIRIADVLKMIKNPHKNYDWGAIVSSVGRVHESFAVKKYALDRDVPSFKQHAYIYTQSALVAKARGYGNDELDMDLILFALLSDSAKAMQGVGLAAPRFIRAGGNQPQSPYFWIHMYQILMLNRMDEVEQELAKAKTQVKKQHRKELTEGRDFFSLLLSKDKVGLEKLLLEKAQEDKTNNPWIEGLIALVPTIEAKLCWLRGIEVEFDHPLVPMELLPIKPLPHYDDMYDFLSPDWVPPRQTIIGKITTLFSK